MPTRSDVSNDLLADYWLPSEQDVIELHAGVIQAGELAGVRDLNMLGSAIGRPSQLLTYRGDQPVHTLAASVAIGVAKNHAFIDGNKRAAFMVLNMTLQENGYRLFLTDDEAVALIEGIAKADHEGGLSEDEFEAIVAAGTRRLDVVSHEYSGFNVSGSAEIRPLDQSAGWHAKGQIDTEQFEFVERTYFRASERVLQLLGKLDTDHSDADA